MPHFDIIKKSAADKTFRVSSILGKFDLQSEEIQERFKGAINIEGKDWNIGVIYGASGTGKSTIAKELWPKDYILGFDWAAHSMIDDFPSELSVDQLTGMFHSVGFASAKSWLKSYAVLSTGERMRADLARAILEKRDLIVFDEYTSTINRDVAKVGSYAVARAVRKLKKQFIAIACHYDILEWLEPDWAFCTDSMSFFLPRDINDRQSIWKYENAAAKSGRFLGNIII